MRKKLINLKAGMNGKSWKKEVLKKQEGKKGMWKCGVIVFLLKYFKQIEVIGYVMLYNHIVESRSAYYTGYAERAFCSRTRVLAFSSWNDLILSTLLIVMLQC